MAPVEYEIEAPPQAFEFTVALQKVALDISFSPRLVKGRTEIIIQPLVENLRTIRLQCRQLIPTSIKVEGKLAAHSYGNLYQRLRLYMQTGIYQYHFPKQRLERHKAGVEDELTITIPQNVRVKELDPYTRANKEILQGINGEGFVNGLNTPTAGTLGEGGAVYAPIHVEIEYLIQDFRDGLQFVGVEDGDKRYPHVYSRNSPFPGMASCLFPCVDDSITKCTFEVAIRCPRTLGDVFSKARPSVDGSKGSMDVDGIANGTAPNGVHKVDSVMSDEDDDPIEFSEEEKAMEMSVVGSGDLTDDIVDPTDPTRKTVSFMCSVPVLPQHIGFAIGPFEEVDLSMYRDTEDDERLGSNAIRVHGFCLPGRADEVHNSAMVLARAIDRFTEKYQSYPFQKSFKLTFVDDLECDVADTASFSICSSRLLFPKTVWEPLDTTTRALVHAVASQWIGVSVTAQTMNDYWVIVGGSWFMTDLYLQELCGRNDYRFRQKMMADEVVRLDVKRPSLFTLGELLALDPGEKEFMELKAPLILSILHNRLVKQHGKNGVDRCLFRLLFNARSGKLPNGAIATDVFCDICEKVGHQRLDTFFSQWVHASGCPTFDCSPSFNKKKMVVQLTIKQTQHEPSALLEESSLASTNFMRDAKEHMRGVDPKPNQRAFVGPMTIRIHEADGTPYEHIVDITSGNTRVEIPYNTKYKRLKRNRRQKERAAAAQGLDVTGDAQEEPTLYSLGDLFNTPEEIAEWRIHDWTAEEETKMENESYEWLRVDADFEWICKTNINDMPSYMYVSQLQQDKDVVAQVESIQYLSRKQGHPILSSIMVKTLMDARYFHGIRAMATNVMAQAAKAGGELNWIGLFHLEKAFREMFYIPNSEMTRTNDFNDRSAYIIQCAIPKAMAKIKGADGHTPMRVKQFLLDTLLHNDNRGNDFSDDHYIATLMSCLAQSLTIGPREDPNNSFVSDEDEIERMEFAQRVIEELGRHQRFDEWVPTYQNLHTVTSLDCGAMLMKNNVIPRKASEFLQYTRVGNADNVRLKAWECLMELGMIKNEAVLKLIVQNIESDPSPYFRSALLRTFGKALGQIALGELADLEKATENASSALIIEHHDDRPSIREAQLARKRTIEGAITGLKQELSDNETLMRSLEDALCSNTTSITDVVELLEICDLLYVEKQEDALWVKLKLPRYWNVRHLGNAKMHFYRINKIRTQPKPALAVVGKDKGVKLMIKKPSSEDRPKRTQTLVLKNKTPSIPQPTEAVGGARVGTVVTGETISVSPAPARPTPVSQSPPVPIPVVTVPAPIPVVTVPAPVPVVTVPAPVPVVTAPAPVSVITAPAPSTFTKAPTIPIKAPKSKNSLIAKLRLSPEKLRQFSVVGSTDRSRKRKSEYEAGDEGRALKRQASADPVGGDRPKWVVKLKVGKDKLSKV
ncbi:hypothetical protein K469DRAFT_661730 [Zopfia rhizophila CBS 207.26]|uniref:Transcription initiation factor TFIID subunit 2 n=1 Tax=Zopfia rhizophila CBS 207.26 TaxID=1314779 RepID=A0A6A6E7B9_9PEZI|nr:hypothetical protein K469DRAFT_661730 [Zopfia rhizophila CBS 207.26]